MVRPPGYSVGSFGRAQKSVTEVEVRQISLILAPNPPLRRRAVARLFHSEEVLTGLKPAQGGRVPLLCRACGCRELCHRPWPAPSRLADLNVTADDETSMIALCGRPPRLPDARSRAELACTARPL